MNKIFVSVESLHRGQQSHVVGVIITEMKSQRERERVTEGLFGFDCFV